MWLCTPIKSRVFFYACGLPLTLLSACDKAQAREDFNDIITPSPCGCSSHEIMQRNFFVVISSSWLVYTRFDQKWSFQGVAIVCEVASVVVNLIRWLFGSIFILEVGVQSAISP